MHKSIAQSQKGGVKKGEKHKTALRTEHTKEVSSENIIKALEKAGFYIARQDGLNYEMKRDDPSTRIDVKKKTRLSRGIIHRIVNEAGLSMEEFKNILEN